MMVLLAVRFLAELGLLACLGIGGWRLGDSLLASLCLGAALPLVAAAAWGRWVAPRAAHRLSDPARLGVEVTLFAAALLAVIGVDSSPGSVALGLAVGTAFLVSLPARTHEAAPTPRVPDERDH